MRDEPVGVFLAWSWGLSTRWSLNYLICFSSVLKVQPNNLNGCGCTSSSSVLPHAVNSGFFWGQSWWFLSYLSPVSFVFFGYDDDIGPEVCSVQSAQYGNVTQPANQTIHCLVYYLAYVVPSCALREKQYVRWQGCKAAEVCTLCANLHSFSKLYVMSVSYPRYLANSNILRSIVVQSRKDLRSMLDQRESGNAQWVVYRILSSYRSTMKNSKPHVVLMLRAVWSRATE